MVQVWGEVYTFNIIAKLFKIYDTSFRKQFASLFALWLEKGLTLAYT